MSQALYIMVGLGVLALTMLQVKYTAIYELELNFASFISLISTELCVENPRNLMNDIKERYLFRRMRETRKALQTFTKVILALFCILLKLINITFKEEHLFIS